MQKCRCVNVHVELRLFIVGTGGKCCESQMSARVNSGGNEMPSLPLASHGVIPIAFLDDVTCLTTNSEAGRILGVPFCGKLKPKFTCSSPFNWCLLCCISGLPLPCLCLRDFQYLIPNRKAPSSPLTTTPTIAFIYRPQPLRDFSSSSSFFLLRDLLAFRC
jgi:hypothetical protein